MPDSRIFSILSPASIILIGLGVLGLWLGFPNPVGQFPLFVFLWPLALLCLGRCASSSREAALHGWLCAFLGMLCVMYWLALPVHNVGGLPWPAAFGCAMLICAVLALQGAFFSFFSHIWPHYSPFASALSFALLWYLLEYFFALLFGFPWLPLAGALMGWPCLAQAASIFGAYALSAVWLIAVFGFALSFPKIRANLNWQFGSHLRWRKTDMAVIANSLLIFCILPLYGLYCLDRANLNSRDPSFNVLMVEGNIDQNQKWLPAFQKKSLRDYMGLTQAGLEEKCPSGERPLVIWPETALPFFLEISNDLKNELTQFVRSINCPLLFGAPAIEKGGDPQNGEIYNRAALFGANGELLGHYDKEHLVPFGEYVPEWLKLDFLEALLQGVGVYSAGTSPAPLRLDRLALGMLICYEGIFPWLAQERVEAGANVLIDISNDGWFGHSEAPAQHLALTLLRCIEQDRWLVRATNTGISVIANEAGQIKLAGPQYQAGFLAGQAHIKPGLTIYHKYGKYYPWLALACVLALFLAQCAIKSSCRKRA